MTYRSLAVKRNVEFFMSNSAAGASQRPRYSILNIVVDVAAGGVTL
jgi:hypothetical protein